ncbi:MAG: single-stranded DNA-binding protein [Myxococcota bacterium]|nr:single-stranded DNA-binding protein [Myxococcota bacterium]
MRSYNRATVLGHVGNDIVLRYTQSGKPVVNLRLATNDRRRDGPETTTWHRVVLWDKLAELASRHVRKGQPVYVEGPLSSRQWTDQAGITHRQIELTARECIFLGESPPARPVDLAASSNELPEASTQGCTAQDGEELDEVLVELPH